jgi:hypothetical protein
MKDFRSSIPALIALAGGLLSPGLAFAQQPASTNAVEVQRASAELAALKQDFDQVRRQYDERLAALEQRLQQLGASVPAATPTAASAPGTPSAGDSAVASAMPPSSGRVFNPDTSVIGNFLGVAGRNRQSEQPALQLTEAEVAFQAVIDPYARGDFYLAAGPEGLEVEEGYATFTSLPHNFLVKAGKMRAQFGKVNTLHTHAMPTADRPLVTDNLVGGEEGLSDSGVSVSRLISNPYVFLEATGEIFAGRSEVFHSTERSNITYVGRLRAYRDLSEDKNLDLGVSYAFGKTNPDLFGASFGAGDLNKQLVGVDVSFKYRPLRRAIYQRLNLRSELIWSRQDLPTDTRTSAFGFYGLGEYQFAQRWYVGARLDRSGRALDGALKDNGGSVFVTFWPTEFSQLRGQFKRTNYADGISANEALFQLNFSIGAHGAHVF